MPPERPSHLPRKIVTSRKRPSPRVGGSVYEIQRDTAEARTRTAAWRQSHPKWKRPPQFSLGEAIAINGLKESEATQILRAHYNEIPHSEVNSSIDGLRNYLKFELGEYRRKCQELENAKKIGTK